MLRCRQTAVHPAKSNSACSRTVCVASDLTFDAALLREDIDTMLAGDINTGKAILRDDIKATGTRTSALSVIRTELDRDPRLADRSVGKAVRGPHRPRPEIAGGWC